MLAVASNLFGKPTSLSAYTLHTANPSPASSSTNLPSTSSSATTSSPLGKHTKPFNVGLWKVTGATHKSTGKEVSVWVFEKRVLDGVKAGNGRGAAEGREWVLERLKKEATSLSRLRHPDILHTVEPLEETRLELTFVTEKITSSLHLLLKPSSSNPTRRGGPPRAEASSQVDLDEVEIQKGTLQIARGLGFLHGQARMVHLDLTPESILINSKGDWKLSGFGLTALLTGNDGTAASYVYPEIDGRLPPQVQWKFDYLAPEYALDSTLSPANDLYSLGCVLHAVHMGGKPPFAMGNSMSSLRDYTEGSLVRREWMTGSKWERLSSELKDLLPRLLTRHPTNRLSLASLPSHPFFSSLAISTLNFLDPTTFASKPREEKATFLRGLVRVLPTFSERLRKGKVLPSLLEEMKDPYLLPFILPNVFEISKGLSKEEFTLVLPKLQPLFQLRDPPQNMLTLLEHLSLFEDKTIPAIFRENVMPLIYNSLECEHLPVQEKVLKTVPHLCEILDYGTVQNILLVKIAILFTKTRILSVKVQTLECFTAMVKTLDKATLTTKLVPLLAKIKTKEPAVMMATLAVHEAMGVKVDREAIATLVLPQLWAMSMGPLLNADQFSRFMAVIRALGSRVEAEHTQHLRDVRRIEQQTASFADGLANGTTSSFTTTNGGDVDFETLVKGGGSGITNPLAPAATVVDPWEDEGWADSGEVDTALSHAFPSLGMSSNTAGMSNFPTSIPSSPAPQYRPSMTSSNSTASSSRLKGRPVPAATFNYSAFIDTTSTPTPPIAGPSFTPLSPPSQHSYATSSFTSIQPTPSSSTSQQYQNQGQTSNGNTPNYNISLTPQAIQPTPSYTYAPPRTVTTHPITSSSPLQPQQAQGIRPPPGWSSGLMQPTIAAKPVLPAGNAKTGWDDFDPLK